MCKETELCSKLYVGLLDQLAATNHNPHGNVDACNATDKADCDPIIMLRPYLTATCVLGAETMIICISCPMLCPAISEPSLGHGCVGWGIGFQLGVWQGGTALAGPKGGVRPIQSTRGEGAPDSSQSGS